MRIGVLGGTFDPVHTGHLRLARAAERKFHLDRVCFVPARQPWHKNHATSPWADRYAMLALALAGHARWLPLDIPPAGGEDAPTYSVNEMSWMRAQHPGDELFFLLGADAFHDLPTWKDFRRLLEICDFILVPRAGQTLRELAGTLPDDMIRKIRRDRIELSQGRSIHWLPRFQCPVSSTTIRQQLAAGERPAEVPRRVAEYAWRAGLYQSAASSYRERRPAAQRTE